MRDLETLLEHHHVLAYETRLADRCAIRTWSEYRGQATPTLPGADVPALHDFVFWQEADGDALGVGGGNARALSRLLTSPDYRPFRYEVEAGGQLAATIDF